MTLRRALLVGLLMVGFALCAGCGRDVVTPDPDPMRSETLTLTQALGLVFPDGFTGIEGPTLTAGGLTWGPETGVVWREPIEHPGPDDRAYEDHPLTLPAGKMPLAVSIQQGLLPGPIGTHDAEAMLAVVVYADDPLVEPDILFYDDTDADGMPEEGAVHTATGLILENEAVGAIAGRGDDWYFACVSSAGAQVILLRDTTGNGYPDTRVGVFADLADLAANSTNADIRYILEQMYVRSLAVPAAGVVETHTHVVRGMHRRSGPNLAPTPYVRLADTNGNDEADTFDALGMDRQRPLTVVVGPAMGYARIRLSATPGRELLVLDAQGQALNVAEPMPFADLWTEVVLNRAVVADEVLTIRETDTTTWAVREIEHEVSGRRITALKIDAYAAAPADTLTIVGSGFTDAQGASRSIDCEVSIPIESTDPVVSKHTQSLIVTVIDDDVLTVTLPSAASVPHWSHGTIDLTLWETTEPDFLQHLSVTGGSSD